MATHQPLLQPPSPRPSHTFKNFLCLLLSLSAIVGPTALIAFHLIKSSPSDQPFLAQVCARAHDPDSCWSLLSEVGPVTRTNGADLLQIFLMKSAVHLRNAIKLAADVRSRINDPREGSAAADCAYLMDLSMDRITNSVSALGKRTSGSGSFSDAHTWLSAVLTNYVTCLDGLTGSGRSAMEPGLGDLISRGRAALAMLVAVSQPDEEELGRSGRGEFPAWVSREDRRLLEATSAREIKADVVVAKDGSGRYKTVGEAVAAAPEKSQSRYVIHVKKGTYKENVEVGKKKTNVMIVGDGMDSTIITGSLNVVDGSSTFNSSTVAAVGDGFIAQDIWFQNTAGPQKHQAVALRVGADQSVINRCRIDAYQDTLYAHSNRQFYRDCFVTGTVDFIFGNAAVVFQNCKLVARKPMDKQSNMVTAQGRVDPNQNTGTSIQYCDIVASSDLEPVKGKIQSYLGRPWKEYSRTVVMQSSIGDHIDPAGWAPWSGDFALKTLYYGEYLDKGAGAGTGKRVKWPGYHVITSPAEAKKFTVAELIQGGVWLKNTGVTFTEGL
ncbi:pectinesterase-like [Malania oleifera]|uniref:pectinesterase-like n=1 Tax=Malania oleifera TaxID=397392 RepID=UPI0025AE8778|nr:pectinesterase-like [Malania oleifera]